MNEEGRFQPYSPNTKNQVMLLNYTILNHYKNNSRDTPNYRPKSTIYSRVIL